MIARDTNVLLRRLGDNAERGAGAHTLYAFDRELTKLAGAAAPGRPLH